MDKRGTSRPTGGWYVANIIYVRSYIIDRIIKTTLIPYDSCSYCSMELYSFRSIHQTRVGKAKLEDKSRASRQHKSAQVTRRQHAQISVLVRKFDRASQ